MSHVDALKYLRKYRRTRKIVLLIHQEVPMTHTLKMKKNSHGLKHSEDFAITGHSAIVMKHMGFDNPLNHEDRHGS